MNMGVIYSGAVCNIAATGLTDRFKGLFVQRDAALTAPIHIHLDADITACDGEFVCQGRLPLVGLFLVGEWC
jgi:hypothetical protein